MPTRSTRVRGPVNVYLDFKEWEEFKELMRQRDITPSTRLRAYIRAELKKAKARTDGKA
jgi:hypothetical protein